MEIRIHLSRNSMFTDDYLLNCCIENKHHHQLMRRDSKKYGFHKLTRKQFGICWHLEFYNLHMGEQNENT